MKLGPIKLPELRYLTTIARGETPMSNNNNERRLALHQIFEEQAIKTPSAIAVEHVELQIRLTYEELDYRANLLAAVLIAYGVKAGSIVAIYLPRGAEQYISMLAILKTGGAYLPIDTELPTDRLSYVLKDSRANMSLTSKELWRQNFAESCQPIFLDDVFSKDWKNSAEQSCQLASVSNEDDLCYVIYTSGTTGFPKGVGISHKNARTFVNAIKQIYGVKQDDRVLQGFSIAFDASVEEIWLAFSVGATLVVGTLDRMRNIDDLSETLKEFEISVFSTVPTLARLMPAREIPKLRLLIVGGEAAHADIIKKWSTPGRKMLNGYVPTECTVTATYAWCSPDKPVTIGKPLPGYGAVVLDDDLIEVPDGTEGELCLFGAAVSDHGYLNHEELSTAKFFYRQGQRHYRTGDLVYRNPEENFVYCGRIDSQVKIRGFRVELEEIEAHLNRLNDGNGAVVGLWEDGFGTPELIAYILQGKPTDFNIPGALADLRRKLPDYMIPGRFVSLDPNAVPTLSSGKINRKDLPPPSECKEIANHELSDPDVGLMDVKSESSPIAIKLLSIWCVVLQRQVGMDDSFFDLGGHSILAAQVISQCRRDPELFRLGIRDLYEKKTVRALVNHIKPLTSPQLEPHSTITPNADPHENKPGESTECKGVRNRNAAGLSSGCYAKVILLQTLTLFSITAVFAYLLYGSYHLEQSLLGSELISPWLAMLLIAFLLPMATFALSVGFGLIVKWTIWGRFVEADLPLWSLGYFRWWLTNLFLAPNYALIGLFVGTPWAPTFCRLFGARVGKGVYLGSPLSELDLITIDDGASIGPGVTLRTHFIEEGCLKLRHIHIGKSAFVGAQSIIGGGVHLGDGCRIHPLSCIAQNISIPSDTEWRGSPAREVSGQELGLSNLLREHEQQFAVEDSWPSWKAVAWIGSLQLCLLAVLELVLLLPLALEVLLFQKIEILRTALNGLDLGILLPASVLFSGLRFFTVLLSIIVLKWLLTGRARSGTIPLNSFEFVRRWFAGLLMTLLVSPLGTRGITETVFMPWVCRLLGMRVGKGSEISDVILLQPDLARVGDYVMLADRCVLGIPIVHCGKMTLRDIEIGNFSFVGNLAHIALTTAKVHDNCLIGVRSIAPDHVTSNSSWLGSPPIRLPRRSQVCQTTTRTTNPPMRLRLSRAFWNLWKMVLPGALVEMVFWVMFTYGFSASSQLDFGSLVMILPLLLLATSVVLLGLPILAKWLLVWRYKPGERFLWSWWMWRLEIAYEVELLVLEFFSPVLAGTPYLPLWYRAMGARIGRRACLTDAFLMEPDLVTIGNNVSVEGSLQTHLFEDRVMRLGTVIIQDYCSIGREACVLYDSEMKTNSHLGDLSLIMNNETFLENTSYHGLPAENISIRRV